MRHTHVHIKIVHAHTHVVIKIQIHNHFSTYKYIHTYKHIDVQMYRNSWTDRNDGVVLVQLSARYVDFYSCQLVSSTTYTPHACVCLCMYLWLLDDHLAPYVRLTTYMCTCECRLVCAYTIHNTHAYSNPSTSRLTDQPTDRPYNGWSVDHSVLAATAKIWEWKIRSINKDEKIKKKSEKAKKQKSEKETKK